MVVPFQAGGTTDLLARLLAEGLGSRLGQPVVAENRGGAGGAVGAEIAARMEPDGHNLFFATIGSAAIIPQMHARLNWRPADLAPVALFAEVPNVFCVAKDAPWPDLRALLADARVPSSTSAHSSPHAGAASPRSSYHSAAISTVGGDGRSKPGRESATRPVPAGTLR